MKKTGALAFAAITLLFLSTGISHAATDGALRATDLREMCQSPSDVDYGQCAGFITAVAQIMLTQSIGPYSACHHAQVRSQQLIDTYNIWAELFPTRMNDDAVIAAAAALARAFPCSK